MAAGLTWLRLGLGSGWRRRVAFVPLVLAVLIVHGWLTLRLADRLSELDRDAAMPARIEVVYVREMALSAPPPVAAPAAPAGVAAGAAPRVRRSRKLPRPAMPASAPEVAQRAASAAPTALPAPEPASQGMPGTEREPGAAPEGDTALAAAPPASSPASAAAPAFEWPVSTRISYLLTGNVRGPVEGSAQVEWIRVGAHYQVHLDLIVGPSFAPVASRSLSSDGAITSQGLVPRRFDQRTRAFGSDRGAVTIEFGPDSVTLADGERRRAVPGVQDTASQFVQLTYLFGTQPGLLRVGGSIDIPVALPQQLDIWTYDVVDEETLHTRFGPLQSIHLKPRRAPRPGALTAEIWFAPQLRYLPVRILIRQTEQTYVDLLIEKPPQISAS